MPVHVSSGSFMTSSFICVLCGDMSTHVRDKMTGVCVCVCVFGWAGAPTPVQHTSCCLTLIMLVISLRLMAQQCSNMMFLNTLYSKTLMGWGSLNTNGLFIDEHLFCWHKLSKELHAD